MSDTSIDNNDELDLRDEVPEESDWWTNLLTDWQAWQLEKGLDFIADKERWDLFNREAGVDWTTPSSGVIDRDRFGPSYPGGGNEPNLEGLTAHNQKILLDRFLSGDEHIYTYLTGASAATLPIALQPLKLLADSIWDPDGKTFTVDGKKLMQRVGHVMKHAGGQLPYIGAAVTIVLTAESVYETYAMGSNLTGDEWACLTADFFSDVGESFAADIMTGVTALVNAIGDYMADPTNVDLVQTDTGAEFVTPAIPVSVNSDDGFTIDAHANDSVKSITAGVSSTAVATAGDDAPPIPPVGPVWYPGADIDDGFDSLLNTTFPVDSIDMDIPLTTVTISVHDMPSVGAGTTPVITYQQAIAGEYANNLEPYTSRKDKKLFGGNLYVKGLLLANATFGKATEVLDFWNLVRYNTYISVSDLPHTLGTGLAYFLSDGKNDYRMYDYIRLGFLPLGMVEEVLEGIIDGEIDFGVDWERFTSDFAKEQAMDFAIGKASSLERAAIQKIFGNGTILDFGNISTWAGRLDSLIKYAQENKAAFAKCNNPE